MTHETTAEIGRTDTKRFSEITGVNESVIEGDRISPKLVAHDPQTLGSPLRPTSRHQDDEPDTEWLTITRINTLHDTYSALLYNPSLDVIARAGRHSKSSAMNQRMADWSVYEVGEEVVVTEIEEIDRPEDEQDEPAVEYAQEWLDILVGENQSNNRGMTPQDQWELDGSLLELEDRDGRYIEARIEVQ